MRRTAFMLILCLVLSPACLAEASSAERFLSNLSETWDSFLDMAEDAGKGAAEWAEASGVAEWAEGAANGIAAWAKESGLTDWAEGALNEVTGWVQSSGIAEWATETSEDVRAFFEENRPAVEAWLAAAGEEVRHAWNTLMNADQHTSEEVCSAYETVVGSLEESSE